MLYDSYQNKIQRIVGFMRRVYAHRVVIASAFAGTVLVVAALLACKGIVIDGAGCPESVPYGTSIGYKAGAFLSSVAYEYAAEGDDEWHAEEPRTVGTYRVRAVSQGTFGDSRYGSEHTYTVTPREAVLTVVDDTLTYGDDPAVTAELVYDDTLTCTGFDLGDLNKTKGKITADPEKATVTDADGNDVTHCYLLTAEEKQITLKPRPISVTVSDKSAVYNGQELTFDGYEINQSTPLVDGDHLQAEFTAAALNVGTVKNTPILHAYNADGEDVTALYKFDIKAGKLTVTPRPLYVTTHGATFVYDGTVHDHTAHDDLAADTLVGDHRLSVVGTTEITDVGTLPNSLVFAVTDADGGDMTGNYSIMVETGVLTVTPRPLTVTTAGDSRQYDGTPFSLPEWTSEGLAEGQELTGETYDYYDSITNVGSISNVLDLVVMAHEGSTIRNVTDNYDITYVYGTLTVTPREVTIQMDDGRWTYDGDPHTATGWSYADGSQEFVEGDLLVIHDTTTVTNVADTRSTCYNEVSDYAITSIRSDLVGSPLVADNYDLTILPGTLVIDPKPVTLVPVQREEIAYDDTHHGADAFDVEISPALVEGHSLADVTFTGGGTDVGDYDVSIVEPVEILDGSGKPVTDNYSVSCEPGILTISPRPLKITTASNEWKYDGETHSDTNYTVTGGMGLVSGHRTNGVRPESVRTVTNASTSSVMNKLDAVIVDADGIDITYRYKISYTYGFLRVTHRELIVKTKSNSWEYDGKSHSYTGYTVVGGDGFVKGDYASGCTDAASITDYVEGGIQNTMTINVYDVDGNPSSNYIVSEWQYGTLQIEKRSITVYMQTSKVYDGEPFTYVDPDNTDFDTRGGKSPVAGHSIRFLNQKSAKDAFEQNIVDVGMLSGVVVKIDRIAIMDGDRDVTENYSITSAKATLIITKRPVFVQSSSSTKYHDGTPLTNPDCETRPDSPYPLPYGHEILGNPTGQRTEVGSSPNTISKSSIYITDADGNNVTSNYDIQSCTSGTLTVERAKLILMTGSAETTYYEGMPPLVCHDYQVTVRGWDTEDYARFDIAPVITGSIMYPGQVLNDAYVESIINRETGKSVINNFEITYDLGILTVYTSEESKTTLAVFPYQVRKYYDGQALVYDDDYCQILDPIEGMEVSISFNINLINVSKLTLGTLNAHPEQYVRWYTVTLNGVDVTDQYKLSFEGMPSSYVVAEVMPCAIELTSEGADLVYDGSVPSLTRRGVYISKGKLADGHYIYNPYIAEGILYNVGSTINTINLDLLVICDKWGRDVTANYQVSTVENELIWRSPDEE